MIQQINYQLQIPIHPKVGGGHNAERMSVGSGCHPELNVYYWLACGHAKDPSASDLWDWKLANPSSSPRTDAINKLSFG